MKVVLLFAVFTAFAGSLAMPQANAQEGVQVKITNKDSKDIYLIAERSQEMVSVQLCQAKDDSCTMIGEPVSAGSIYSAISDLKERKDYPLNGVVIGQHVGLYAPFLCIIVKKCLGALRAFKGGKFGGEIAFGSMVAGSVIGGMTGWLMQEGIDTDVLQNLTSGYVGTIEVEESIESVVEEYSLLLMHIRKSKK